MIGGLIVGCLVAALAVFGLICGAQMIVELCFPLRQLAVTVEVRTREDAEILDMLLREARNSLMGRRHRRVGVLLSANLCENEQIPQDVLQLLKQYGADCYLVEGDSSASDEL